MPLLPFDDFFTFRPDEAMSLPAYRPTRIKKKYIAFVLSLFLIQIKTLNVVVVLVTQSLLVLARVVRIKRIRMWRSG